MMIDSRRWEAGRLIYHDKVKYVVGKIGSATITSGLAIFEQENVLNLYVALPIKHLTLKLNTVSD